MSQDEPKEPTGMEVAVIGMACKFPGANSVDEFWRNLAGGVESLTRVTEEDLEAAGEDPEYFRHPNYVPVMRKVDDPDLFDAAFFGISPREAELLDPQMRLLLECSWQAMEDAAYDPASYGGLVGVYAGTRFSGYMINLYSHPDIVARMGEFQTQISNDKDYLATHIAYKLSLGGPAITVQTACSTSLVAVHLACQSLLAGECDMALAGGVSVRGDLAGYMYREGEIFSPDGHVRTFDAGADGTIFGNGLGMVVLKPLEDALADGDNVRAVILGSAVNNDSSDKVGYTAPGAGGQARVIRAAQTVADVDPETLTYVEAHGTGTPTGDPIEISALTRAFREATSKRGFCAIGSVKTNVGHLGAAAGVAGLMKTVLALEHRRIPPSLLFEKPNPQIDFESSPFFVNTELSEWRANGSPRRAGVSAFGIGGTNAHAILEEAPEREPASPSRAAQLLLLSARTEAALEEATARLAEHLESRPGLDLADAAYTLKVGRRRFAHRRTLVCRDRDDALAVLRSADPKRLRTSFSEAGKRSVAFMFSGQGAQYPGMGQGLYRSEPAFREEIDRCCKLLEPHLGRDLRELLHPAGDSAEAAAGELEKTCFTQPALFVVEYAAARLWSSCGVVPEAMIGHSIGEYVAACLAGVFRLEDALALVAARGRLMQGLPAGSMLAVPLSEDETREELGPQLSIATLNAPERCVVSGPAEAVDALREQLADRGVKARPLHTSHAFHSAMMEPVLEPFLEALRGIELGAPRIPFVSNVSGTWIREDEATDPGYWAAHLRRPVRFADGVRTLLEEPGRILLEAGPGNTLVTLARRHPDRGPGHLALPSIRHPKAADDDQEFLLGTLGQLWMAGVDVDWQGFYGDERRCRVPLPTYPFERRRFWIERNPDASFGGTAARRLELADWFYLPTFRPSVPPVLPAAGSQDGLSPARRWLLFADGDGLGARLAGSLRERLTELGREVLTVRAGSAFRSLGEDAWEIAPGERRDYDALFAELREQKRLPGRVLHLWNVYGERLPLDDSQARSFYSLLYLAQAVGKIKLPEAVHLAVASNGALRIGSVDDDELFPEKATLFGPCQVIPREIPHLRPVAVDLGRAGLDADPIDVELVDRLLAEAEEPSPGAIVAYRGGERWFRDYVASPIDRAVDDRLRLRRGGCYLITGGLGGFGLTFADFLARDFGARLVLVGRSALPERAAWSRGLDGFDERVRRKVRKVLELEEAGAEVLVESADVADEDDVRRVLEAIRARFGELHGVIHAAGVAGGGLIQLKTPAMAERVLAPKVRGTLALAAALGEAPLDFFLLCSSTIAVLGTLGQVDYCAGNCFLDAFAEAHAGAPTRPISINWGAWQEVGMAVETAPPTGLRASSGAAVEEVSGTAVEEVSGTAAAEVAVEEVSGTAIHPLIDRRVHAEEVSGTAVEATAVEAVESAVEEVSGTAIHPLIDRRVRETATEIVFATDFEVGRHWVLDEHRILGNPAVPGTTYLELARAAFAQATGNGAGAEISEVFFFQPLMVREGEPREARVVLEPLTEVGFKFRVLSGGGDGVVDHARGKVAPLAADGAARFDVADILARCGEPLEVEGGLGGDDKLVYWGPRWQSLRRVHLGDGEGLAELVLPREFTADLDGLVLHPALVDVATALTSGLAEGENYLPLSYRKVRVFGRLPATIYSYLRLEGDAAGETISADVSLLDEDGRELVAIEHFTMKRVGEARQRLSEGVPAEAPSAPQGLFAAGGIRPAEGVEVLRRVLSRVRQPRVVVSSRDLEGLRRQLEAGQQPSTGLAAELSAAASPQQAHPRPDLSTAYVAPSDDVERALAEIWQNVLGLDAVGVHDNFFELGGDSVLGITVISQTAEAGYELAPEQLFEHQSIAELAEVLAAGSESAGTPAGEAPAAEAPPGEFADSGLAPEELDKVLAQLERIT